MTIVSSYMYDRVVMNTNKSIGYPLTQAVVA